MISYVMLGLCVAGALWCIATQKRWAWNKAQKMYGYFEYVYDGEPGSSRDYGPMLEIDMVGAMRFRQELGAQITFEQYSPDEEKIMELIDKREYFRSVQNARRK